ncbi:hypothetical protein IE53DRAFT_373823 [Violaceomyces palustris]|uniref:Uncharacterized protein n=1 Tax=Violaceomyces palustris TaxID=1673888 RepID=A0ACD0P1N0_9BASI|nr:hypothetical protein IE53DRAFT_373823 [Violaceomyces palustris]
MESSIDQVAAKCATQLEQFQTCILSNQSNPSICDPQKSNLSKCAAEAVPLVNEIKNRCVKQVKAYDLCLAMYQDKGEDELERRCTPKLRDLWICTERVKKEVEASSREKSGSQAKNEGGSV